MFRAISFVILAAFTLAAEMRNDIEFARPGGESLTLDAHVPNGKGPFPAVIIVHGGGFTAGTKQTYVPPLFAPLTEAGFAWFTINYRLAPKSAFPAAVDDVETAVRWVRKNASKYRVDPKRIALVGESAGGHLVAYAGARLRGKDAVQAVVPFYPPTDLVALTNHRGQLSDGLKGFVAVSERNAETDKKLAAASPVGQIHSAMPPYLFIHGTKDPQVPFSQSPLMCDAMRKIAARCEVYPIFDAGHGVGNWEKDAATFHYKSKMVDWLKQELHHGTVTRTALDRWVATEDPAYKYSLVSTKQTNGVTMQVLDMTSQKWRSSDEVDRTEWKHWVTILRPAQVKHATALLFIGGGNNGRAAPDTPDATLLNIAKQTGAVVAELRMVPNQPLVFPGEKPRTEDAMIAYTWDKFLKGGDELWPARLPMTKAAVRAMDTVTAFAKSAEGGGVNVEKFVVAGGSKRGWTTWTTAVVDKRVVAIMPVVIDMLNVVPSFIHHWQVYGFWAPAVGDYVAMRIMEWNETPRYKELMKIVEPYEYRERLTIPKYMINASGDQFFLPDSSQFYFKDLIGEKHLRYVPSADHSLRGSDAPLSMLSFFDAVLNNRARPEFSWTKGKDGSLSLKVKDEPSEVKIWQATNESARDFRLMTIGPKWTASPLELKNGAATAKVPAPAKGWTAFFVELTYKPKEGNGPALKFTTEVSVVPDTLPYPRPKPGDGLPPKSSN
jgi:PhoPQ-activated pathogenicity-related protein